MSSERGSAGIWILCVCLVLSGAGSVAMAFGAAVVGRHRASSVADLAALAAAAAQARGDPQPCLAATRLAAANRGRVVSCTVETGSVLVVAEVGTDPPLYVPPARARARAGGLR